MVAWRASGAPAPCALRTAAKARSLPFVFCGPLWCDGASVYAFAAIVFVAFVVESAAGFGATVVTVTLAAQLMAVDDVLARFLPLNVALSLYLVTRHRKAVDVKLLFRGIVPAMALGMIGGTVIARVAQPGWIKVAFAIFVIALSIFELVPRAAPSRPLPTVVRWGALGVAGIIHGLFACGGPLVVWVLGREMKDKAVFRSTLSALWLLLNTVLLITFVATRKMTPATLADSAWLVLPLGFGIAVGEAVHRRLSEAIFRKAIFALLLVAATILLVRR